jgi:hypothetical protein
MNMLSQILNLGGNYNGWTNIKGNKHW